MTDYNASLSKRFLDVTIAAAGILITAPVFAGVAAAIQFGSPGPILYRGRRVGLGGCAFEIFKFRTMVVDAERYGGSATAADDPRITAIGKHLRKYKLDELPQLFNVLLGHMSLVGPRPEVQKYVDMYTHEEKAILQMRPGITDWASIWNADEAAVLESSPDPEAAYEEIIRPTKLALQLHYARTQSLSTDLRILFHTAARLVNRTWYPKELEPYGKIQTYRSLSQQASS